MLRDDAVSRIKRGLGFRTDLDAVIVDALQEAQRAMEMGKSLPYFLLSEDNTISVLVGVQSYALPAGFLREAEDLGPYRLPSELDYPRKYLSKVDISDLSRYYSQNSEGYGQAYALRQASLVIFPIPDVAYTLYWDYYKKGDLLTSNVENVWLKNAPDLLIGAAGMIVAADVRDQQALQTFSALFSTWNTQVRNETFAREIANEDYAMGSEL